MAHRANTSLAAMRDAKNRGLCPFCNKDMKDASFKDIQSEREFKLSGLCQDCQDSFFTPDNEA